MHVGSLEFFDLTGAFVDEWDRTSSWPEEARVVAFKARFAPLLPGFYGHERFGAIDSSGYDRCLMAALRHFPEERENIAEVGRRFSDLLGSALERFEDAFGPLAGVAPVYLVHSLGEFDGGMRSLPNGDVLLFGADVIARLHFHHDIRPFFHHELFHLHHARSFLWERTVWADLWCEGLATYVASRLNPGATDAELLLDFPEPIRARVEANRPLAIREALTRFDSTASSDRDLLFTSRRSGFWLPPRAGYYIGYAAMAELGQTRSPTLLADVQPREARQLLKEALETLAGA